MTTLDEAIVRLDEMADYDYYGDYQKELVDFWRQIAGWLRELKKLKEDSNA